MDAGRSDGAAGLEGRVRRLGRQPTAWARTVELAEQAEALGFESLWVFDHFHTVPDPTDEITFESFSVLSALAMATERVRLGHMVVCTGFRNPALTAKMASTIDVISGGRFELGIGAGWKEDEWRAYGYGFPTLAERMAPSVTTSRSSARCSARAGRRTRAATPRSAARSTCRRASRPHIPIIVGGNGERVTAGYAIRYARRAQLRLPPGRRDRRRMAAVRARCEAKAAIPATLRFSLYTRDEEMRDVGQERVDTLAGFAEIGLDRIVCFPTRWSPTIEAQAAFAEDCRAAGISLG